MLIPVTWCHLMSHFSYMCCDVRVKSQNPKQIHVLGYCRNALAQYGQLPTSGPDFYINITEYYKQMKTQVI